MAYVDKNADKIAARLAVKNGGLDPFQKAIAVEADAGLMEHADGRDRFEITTSKGKLDRYVNLDGDHGADAMGFEEGHQQEGTGEWVEGAHVLTNAMLEARKVAAIRARRVR